MNIANTSGLELERLFREQKRSFSFSNVTSMVDRKAKLKKLAATLRNYESKIVNALQQDFSNRSTIETRSAEIGGTIAHIHYTLKNLKGWSASKKISNLTGAVPGKAYVRREPKGVVGIISPWNYPIQLALIPLVTAIAAGNRVMLKPSESTPTTSALMVEMLSKVFDSSEVAVVIGEADIAAAFSRLPWDHLFYTGSTEVGRLVAIEAAKNLTPVSLELGGKSPVIMMPDADINDHSKRVAMGKFYNGGQTCVAPDYMLVPKGKSRAYGNKIIGFAKSFYTDGQSDETFTSLINDRSYERITQLVEGARQEGCDILTASISSPAKNTRHIDPTVILSPSPQSEVMKEEIFGPVLPILEYDTIDQAIDFITERDHPLALYVFGQNVSDAKRVMERTTSGGAVINGSILHVALEQLPFGGVGKSGYGAYHGERGFAEFSHERSILIMPKWKFLTDIITPPYGKLLRTKISRVINSA